MRRAPTPPALGAARRLRALVPLVAIAAALLTGCLPRGTDTTETPTVTPAPTPIPMLRIVTPTPGPPPVTPTPAASGEEGAPNEQAASSTYVVQPGDTLYGIAVQLNVDPQALAEANGITDPSWLEAGQVLIVPGRNQP